MAPRFWSSPYKNALPAPAKREAWYSELPIHGGSNDASAGGKLAATSEYLLTPSSHGSLAALRYDAPRKYDGQVPLINAGATSGVVDLAASSIEDVIAAGKQDGSISVAQLPPLEQLGEDGTTTVASTSSFTSPSLASVSFHPCAASLLLSASTTGKLALFDLSGNGEAFATIDSTLAAPWRADWTTDGKLSGGVCRDGTLRLWDVRGSSTALETKAHQTGNKPARMAALDDGKIITAGTGAMRERELALFDVRNPATALKRVRCGQGGALVPVADLERNIVFAAGKGDMSLRWVELGGPNVLSEGSAPLPAAFTDMVLAPAHLLDIMHAEIDRLYIAAEDVAGSRTEPVVVPVPVNVPRRQYVDFHQDLFPPLRRREPASDVPTWRAGEDRQLLRDPQDPSSRRPVRASKLAESSAPATNATAPATAPEATRASAPQPATSQRAPEPAQKPVTDSVPSPPKQSVAPSTIASTAAPSSNGSVTAQSSAARSPPSATPVAPSSANAQPRETRGLTPRWSRKFMASKTPLKPDYHDVHSQNAGVGPDMDLFKASTLYFFYPLAGPGGRLAVHPIAAKGRLPTHIPGLVCGSGITDYALDPFDPARVFVACEDSAVRVWSVPSDLSADMDACAKTLSDSSMDKVTLLRPHPTASDLLLTVSNDRGDPSLRVWDVTKGNVVLKRSVGGGITSAAWSPEGKLLALATRSKSVIVLDLREETSRVAPAHDSVRPARLEWVSDECFISTGFTRSASRELILYRVGAEVAVVAKQTLDVSPAPLFPHADLDTNVLFLHSRGERTVLAIEVQPNDAAPFTNLPPFSDGALQSGLAYLPKRHNDIAGVEIVRALRLTPSAVQVVSFSIPRAKADFFQDDVFPPTRDVEAPALTAEAWFRGENAESRRISLQPNGMQPLSQAPVEAPKASTRSQIADGPVMTDSQKQDAFYDRLFDAAKDDSSEESDYDNRGTAPDDDDW